MACPRSALTAPLPARPRRATRPRSSGAASAGTRTLTDTDAAPGRRDAKPAPQPRAEAARAPPRRGSAPTATARAAARAATAARARASPATTNCHATQQHRGDPRQQRHHLHRRLSVRRERTTTPSRRSQNGTTRDRDEAPAAVQRIRAGLTRAAAADDGAASARRPRLRPLVLAVGAPDADDARTRRAPIITSQTSAPRPPASHIRRVATSAIAISAERAVQQRRAGAPRARRSSRGAPCRAGSRRRAGRRRRGPRRCSQIVPPARAAARELPDGDGQQRG